LAVLLALLYENDGELSAAAPACDQQSLGDRYWLEIYPEKVRVRDRETAYVNIDNSWLVEKLLKMDFTDEIEAAAVVDTYLRLSTTVQR
jgi:hypothetical protein